MVALLLLGLSGFFLFFFRDPERRAPSAAGAADVVLSPADGRVLVAGPAVAEAAPPGAWQQISMFLSPMDVHVNRIPASGRVTQVDLQARPVSAGLPARRRGRQRAQRNLDRPLRTDVVAPQIVGILARRVVCRVEPGTEVRAGERFGIMKFGSRMDVFLPLDATLAVSGGRRRAGRRNGHRDATLTIRPPGAKVSQNFQ